MLKDEYKIIRQEVTYNDRYTGQKVYSQVHEFEVPVKVYDEYYKTISEGGAYRVGSEEFDLMKSLDVYTVRIGEKKYFNKRSR